MILTPPNNSGHECTIRPVADTPTVTFPGRHRMMHVHRGCLRDGLQSKMQSLQKQLSNMAAEKCSRGQGWPQQVGKWLVNGKYNL